MNAGPTPDSRDRPSTVGGHPLLPLTPHLSPLIYLREESQ